MNLMNRCLIGVALFGAFSTFGEESSTVAFYAFKDNAPNEFVTTVTNSVDAELYVGTPKRTVHNNAESGTIPIFSDDAPGSHIYDGLDRSKLLVQNPQSVKFYPATNENNEVVANTGGIIELAGLAKKISELDEGTLEFFGKVDTFNAWKNFIAFNAGQPCKLANQSTSIFTFQNLWVVNAPGSTVMMNCPDLTGKWYHFALNWSKESNVVDCYIDHSYKGSTFLTNSTLSVSTPVILGASIYGGGNEAIDGKISCLRLSSRILEPTEMLWALDTSYDTSSPCIGFWDFKDGAVGSQVDTVSNRQNENFGRGTAATFNDGEPATFSSEAPGVCILESSINSRVLSENPQSIHFTGDASNSKKGSGISFPGVAEVLAQSPAWTVEFFARRTSTSSATWRTPLSFHISELVHQYVKISLPTYNVDWVNIQEQAFNNLYGSEITASVKNTDQWKHYAITFTNNQMRFYVDFELQTQSRKHHEEYEEILDGGNVVGIRTNSIYQVSEFLPITNSPLNLVARCFNLGKGHNASGYEQFAGDISCLRINTRVLNTSEFMVASTLPITASNAFLDNTTVFHWRGEGADGADVVVEDSYPNGIWLLKGFSGTGAATSRICAYDTNAINPNRPYVWYGERKTPYMNTSCIEFFGYDGVNYTGEWDGSVLNNAKTSVDAYHPESWTMECFLKVRDQASYKNMLIFGKGWDHNQFSWKVRTLNNCDKLEYSYSVSYNASNQSETKEVITSQTVNIKDGKWHHFAVSYDALTKTMKMYLDYEKILEKEQEVSLLPNTDKVYRLGRYCSDRGFSGWMDEIRFSNTVLEPDEFIKLMPSEGLTIMFR